MTTPSTPRKAGPLQGNGATTAFPFSFKVFSANDVKVAIADSAGTETELVLNTHYTVALNANQETSPGGTVTYPVSGSPLATGSVLSIIGDLDYDQPLDLPSGGNFSPLALENQLDRTTMQIQQLREEMDRTAKLPPTSSESVEDLVDDLQRLADSADNIDTVAGSIANVNTVAGNIANVNTVGANIAHVAATGANIAAVVTVAGDLNEPVSEIETVAASIANVNTVGANIANVTTVAGVSANVTTVAGIAADVTSVAGMAGDVTNFADVYQGAKAADPTLRNDGSALQAGDMYFNTVDQALRVYGGTLWKAGAAGEVTTRTFSGDGVETVFDLGIAPGDERVTQVYISGIYQQKATYSVSGADIVFGVAPPVGTDNIEVVTISTLAIGETDASLVSYTPSGAGATVTDVQAKLREFVSVTDFGAVGDWNGVTGTDNLPALEAAVSALPASGGVIAFPENASNGNDYWISDSWNIRKSNVTVRIPRGVTLRATTNTSSGHTIAFAEGSAYGGSDAAQLENVEISGGGIVRNSAPGTNDNAIAFTRCKNYRCIGMHVPAANKKGITAQVHCDDGHIVGNIVGTTGDSGIACEGDALGIYRNEGLLLADNIVENAGDFGINVTFAAGSTYRNVVSRNNRVLASVDHAFAYSSVEGLQESGNTVVTTQGRAFSYQTCSKVKSLTPQCEQAGFQGIALLTCGEDVEIVAPTMRNTSNAASNTYDAIVVNGATADCSIIAPNIYGATHKLSVGTASMGSNVVRVVNHGKVTAGVSGTWGPIATIDLIERTDGGRKQQTISYAATIAPDYLLGSSVLVGQLTGNITINAPTNAKAGQSMLIRLVQDGAGGRTVSTGANVLLTGAVTTTGNTVTLLQFEFDGSKWRGFIRFTGQAI